jgi:hypothetical protein
MIELMRLCLDVLDDRIEADDLKNYRKPPHTTPESDEVQDLNGQIPISESRFLFSSVNLRYINQAGLCVRIT